MTVLTLLRERLIEKLQEFYALHGFLYVQSKVPLAPGFLIPDVLLHLPELMAGARMQVLEPATHEEFEEQVYFLGLTLEPDWREGILCYKCEAVD